MDTWDKIYIVGIGDDGLEGVPAAARELLDTAELLIGDAHTLSLLPSGKAERLIVGTRLEKAVDCIRGAAGAADDKNADASMAKGNGAKRTVVVVYGDPMFYGLARYLCDRLGKDRFEVIPHVSSMQLAFARVKESWEDAYLTNLANHPLEAIVERIRVAETVGLFTTDTCTPSALAQALLQRNIDYFSAYVCENLGSPDERVTSGTLPEIAGQSFSSLNVMILVRPSHTPDRAREAIGLRRFGNPDETFLQSKPKRGLLTPSEVRTVALAEMCLLPESIVWDVGAGSGSVSVEAAQLADRGKVYAIEMDAEDHQLIQHNSERFEVANVIAVLGKAPDAWKELPEPDTVFVGGSGREISRLVDLVYERLKPGGRLVANVGSIENLSEVHKVMSQRTSNVQVWMFNVARGTYQLERVRFDALNPTFLLGVTKG